MSAERVTYRDEGHTGWDGVRFLHRLLLIDDAWTQWHDDGFTWWGYRIAQRYRWEGPTPVDGVPTWFYSVETDLFRGVHHPAAAHAFIDRANDILDFGGGAFTLEGDRIRHRARTYAMGDTAEQRARFLANAGIAANALATRITHTHTANPDAYGRFGVDPTWLTDASAHPTAGARPQPDGMLRVIQDVFLPHGQEPAAAALDLGFDQTVHLLLRQGAEAFGGEFDRVVIARWPAPFGHLTCRIDRAYRHDALGFGLRSRLHVTFDRRTLARLTPTPALARALTALDLTAKAPLLSFGAWTIDQTERPGTLVHTEFYPNAGLPNLMALQMIATARARGWWLEGALQEVATEG